MAQRKQLKLTADMRRIEAEHGQDIKDVLYMLYMQHGNMNKVANELGVTRVTTQYWLRKLGISARLWHLAWQRAQVPIA